MLLSQRTSCSPSPDLDSAECNRDLWQEQAAGGRSWPHMHLPQHSARGGLRLAIEWPPPCLDRVPISAFTVFLWQILLLSTNIHLGCSYFCKLGVQNVLFPMFSQNSSEKILVEKKNQSMKLISCHILVEQSLP